MVRLDKSKIQSELGRRLEKGTTGTELQKFSLCVLEDLMCESTPLALKL